MCVCVGGGVTQWKGGGQLTFYHYIREKKGGGGQVLRQGTSVLAILKEGEQK